MEPPTYQRGAIYLDVLAENVAWLHEKPINNQYRQHGVATACSISSSFPHYLLPARGTSMLVNAAGAEARRHHHHSLPVTELPEEAVPRERDPLVAINKPAPPESPPLLLRHNQSPSQTVEHSPPQLPMQSQ